MVQAVSKFNRVTARVWERNSHDMWLGRAAVTLKSKMESQFFGAENGPMICINSCSSQVLRQVSPHSVLTMVESLEMLR